MARARLLGLTLLLSGLAASPACALGSDYTRRDLETKGQLVPGLKPVHGYWINWTDTFFYQGDTKTLNQFLAAYGGLKGVELRVVLHPGMKEAASPWDKQPRGIPADWSLYVWNASVPVLEQAAGNRKLPPTCVDIWTGRIKLDELQIPEHVEVSTMAKLGEGGEIGKFLAKRRKSKE